MASRDRFDPDWIQGTRMTSILRLRQRGDSNSHRAVGFRDHAQSLGVEFDLLESQVNDRSVDANAGGILVEIRDRRLDALARIRRERQ